MDLLEVIQIILGTIVSIGVVAIGLGYGYGKFKSGADDSLRESNDDLRESNNDLKEIGETHQKRFEEKVEKLTKQLNASEKKVANFEGQLEQITKKNTGYEALIVRALSRYLDKNPQLAKEFLDEGLRP